MDCNNPSAFPLLVPASLNLNQHQQAIIDEQMQKRAGMSLLDYFATRAMGSIVSRLGMHYPNPSTCAAVAGSAYDLAEAMIAERQHRLKKSQQ